MCSFFLKHKKISGFLSKKSDKKSAPNLRLIILFIFFLFCLLLSINSYINSGFITSFDIKLSNLFFYSKNNNLISFLTFITSIGNSLSVILSLCLLSLLFLFLKRKKYIIFLYISVGITSLSTYILKELFKRPRPELSLYINQGFSFPSGHSSITVAIYGFLIYFFLKNLKTVKNKIISTTICLFLIFSIAFSRLYLNAHYLSDVIAGLLLGFTVLLFSIIIFKGLNKKE